MELIQEIAEHLPREDQLALSMVSKSLRAATLPVVSRTINATDKTVRKVDKAPKWLTEGVRSIFYRVGSDSGSLYSGSDYGTFLTRDLNKFPHLTSLHLALKFQYLDSELILHLQGVEELTDLTLEECGVTSKGFATLVKFPKLTRLTLLNVEHHMSEPSPFSGLPSPSSGLPTPSPRRPPRELSIADFSYAVLLLDIIFSVSWDEVSILSGHLGVKLATRLFIDYASSNLKRLELQENIICTYRDRPVILPWEC